MTAATASSGWSEARVERLKALWLQGRSASQIAKELGATTRNAVIGKVHRLGLAQAGREGPSRPGAARAARLGPRARRRAPAARRLGVCIALRAPAVDGPGLYAGFDVLPAHRCKWPIGDPSAAGFSFCGQPARNGPYCAAHAGMAYQPKRAEPPARAPGIQAGGAPARRSKGVGRGAPW